MFYGSKEQFERQKKEFMDVAQHLWLTDPFYFMQTDFFNRTTGVVIQVEAEIGMSCLSWAGGEEILKYKTEVLKYQQSVILNNKIVSKWMAEQEYKRKRSAELYKLYNKIIGFLAGIGQVATGVGDVSDSWK